MFFIESEEIKSKSDWEKNKEELDKLCSFLDQSSSSSSHGSDPAELDPRVTWKRFKEVQQGPRPFVLGNSADWLRLIRNYWANESASAPPRRWKSPSSKEREDQKELDLAHIEILFEILSELHKANLDPYQRARIIEDVMDHQSRLLAHHLVEEGFEAGWGPSWVIEHQDWVHSLKNWEPGVEMLAYDFDGFLHMKSVWGSVLECLAQSHPHRFKAWSLLLENFHARQQELAPFFQDPETRHTWYRQVVEFEVVMQELESLKKTISPPGHTEASFISQKPIQAPSKGEEPFEKEKQEKLKLKNGAEAREERFHRQVEEHQERAFKALLDEIDPLDWKRHKVFSGWFEDLTGSSRLKFIHDERWWAMVKARHDEEQALNTQKRLAKTIEEWPLSKKDGAGLDLDWFDWVKEKKLVSQGFVSSYFKMNRAWSEEALRRGLCFENAHYLDLWLSASNPADLWQEWRRLGLSDQSITEVLVRQWSVKGKSGRRSYADPGSDHTDKDGVNIDQRPALTQVFPEYLKGHWEKPLQEWVQEMTPKQVLYDIKRVEEMNFLLPSDTLDNKWIQWGQLLYHHSDLWREEISEYRMLYHQYQQRPSPEHEKELRPIQEWLTKILSDWFDLMLKEGSQLQTELGKMGLKIVSRELMQVFPVHVWMDVLEAKPEYWDMLFGATRCKHQQGERLSKAEYLDHPWVWTFFTVSMGFGSDNSDLYLKEDFKTLPPHRCKQWLESLKRAGWGLDTLYMPKALWIHHLEDKFMKKGNRGAPNEPIWSAVNAQYMEEQLQKEWGTPEQETIQRAQGQKGGTKKNRL